MIGRLLSLPSRLRAALAGAVALLLALGAAYAKGRRDAAQRAKMKGLRDYQRTRQEIDDAPQFTDDNSDVSSKWLRKRKHDRDL
jgi:hypothetical protein